MLDQQIPKEKGSVCFAKRVPNVCSLIKSFYMTSWRSLLGTISVYQPGLQRLFSLSINLPIIFTSNRLIAYSVKCQKGVKNAHLNFPEPDVTSSDCFFCSNNNPKHKDSFIFIYDSEKQQILTFETLIRQFFLLFLFEKMTEMININYQKSWQLFFFWLIIRLIVATVLSTCKEEQ